MDSIANKLISGSARINQMRKEIELVTEMLFGLAQHPRMWISAHKLEHKWDEFQTNFGTFVSTRGVWDVWWSEERFHTRFMLCRDSNSGAVCGYIKDSGSVPSKLQTHIEDRRYAGIQQARENLDVFVEGMLSEFPIQSAVQPFIEAARSSTP